MLHRSVRSMTIPNEPPLEFTLGDHLGPIIKPEEEDKSELRLTDTPNINLRGKLWRIICKLDDLKANMLKEFLDRSHQPTIKFK